MNSRLEKLGAAAAMMLLLATLSGCAGGMRTETIVIPDTGEAAASDTGSRPFEVKTIYRLPARETSVAQLLGWSAPDAVAALSANIRPNDRLTYSVQSFSPPYERPEMLMNLDAEVMPDSLSPDGRYLSGITQSGDSASIRLMSLSDGEERTVATLAADEGKLLKGNGAWSSNGRYLAYLFVYAARQTSGLQAQASDGNARAEESRAAPTARPIGVLVCDTLSGTAEQHPLTDLDDAADGMAALPSDDGSALLITSGSALQLAARSGDAFEVQYEHSADGTSAAAWLSSEQFAFLGEDGTLYAYDRRNGDIAVLLEKIGLFRLSQDRKAIAYYDSGTDAIYAGKLQGNNVLYGQTVYQGILPAFMDWNPDGRRLLIDGRKLYPQTARPAPTAEPAAEEQPLADTSPDDRQLIVEFQ